MLEELLKMVANNSTESIINNPAVPNEHNENVINAASSSIMDTVKNLVSEGKLDQVSQLVSNPNNATSQLMQSGFVENIVNKFGIDEGAAKNIAVSLIPQVLSQLNVSSGSGFNLNNLSDSLGKLGLDKNGDGNVDLKDVSKMFGL